MEADNIGAPFPLVGDRSSPPTNTRATWIGLFLSLFAMVVIRQAFVFFVPEITFAAAILKEMLIWASAAALLIIIRRGERLPFRSIGFCTCRWWKSIAWGLVIAVVSAAEGPRGIPAVSTQAKILGTTFPTKSTKPWPIILAARSRRHK